MTPLTPPYRALPRSVRELILRDLARQTRTLKGIAERHHVPVDAVTALRNDFGPGPVELLTAAEELARPQKPAPKPVATSPELDASERKECRAWALTTGRTTASTGPLPHAIVNAWIEAGRPIAEAPPTPAPAPAADPVEEEEVPAEDSIEEAASRPETPIPAPVLPSKDCRGEACSYATPHEHGFDCDRTCPCWEGAAPAEGVAATDSAAPYCATCDDTEVVVRDGKVTACACSPEDGVVDAEILPPWHDWPALLDRADHVPAVAFELRAVIHAVDMLRDALREHDHREQLVMRVQDAIKPQGLHLTADQVRLVLDAIEAA